ncbi:DUF4145 domain-containing protein [Vibrio parahaemolyticus]|uniref:DUF4145 domain-containing protein n=1 Tax=Vibrio parahaemolyticus TaxID=670 RepID=UPI000ABDC198|nr:DUF4145 domain-containing protein [Vibrio parahaemolyticus]MDG2637755.1 DUF4145 domain-containing protein [Vibrio parahaemolyticus]
MSYEAPELNKEAFTCPHCNAFAAMKWGDLRENGYYTPVKHAICHRCRKASIWLNGTEGYPSKLLYPSLLVAPLPNEDMPEECQNVYLEAREIATSSPRGAAALLRLCIQELMTHLGGDGKNINKDIGKLVEIGLPAKIQQALDFVRVIGNNAVHPGEISLDDDPQTVSALFGLINLIVDSQITQPKHVESLFNTLPQGAIEAVTKRDQKA